MRPSNRSSRPVAVSAARIRGCALLDATHHGSSIASSAAAMPSTGRSSVAKAAITSAW